MSIHDHAEIGQRMEPQSSFMIKRVAKEDFELLSHLRNQLWPQDSIAEHIKDFTDLSSTHGHVAFMAFDAKIAIAFAEVSLRFYVNGCHHRPVGFIEGLWCKDGYRNLGIGQRLSAQCEEWARENGAKELATDAYLENEMAHKAYQNWGFEMTETVVYFRKKL